MNFLEVNQERYDFNSIDISSIIENLLKEYEAQKGRKPWAIVMGVNEYASLVLYLKRHYMSGDMAEPYRFNKVPCYCHKDFGGNTSLLSSFEDILKELV